MVGQCPAGCAAYCRSQARPSAFAPGEEGGAVSSGRLKVRFGRVQDGLSRPLPEPPQEMKRARSPAGPTVFSVVAIGMSVRMSIHPCAAPIRGGFRGHC